MKILASLGLLLAAVCGTATAQSFEMAVMPSRVAVAGKAGQRVGQSLTLTNVGRQPTEVAVRTLDWTFTEDGNVVFHDDLQPGSCRPWVTIERRFVKLAPQAQVPFRFQIEVPPEATRTECRFMMAVEGVAPAYRSQMQSGGASLSLPVTGRIAIAVYVVVGGAEPKLEFRSIGVQDLEGKRTPVMTVTNSGDAHGRLEGSLSSVDARGLKFELIPEGTPLMPGQTRTLRFSPKADAKGKLPEIALPIRSEGQLDWDLGSFKVDVEFK